MKKGKSNKKKSPSRERYEQNHPTRSFRTSKELDDRIEAIKKTENMSFTDIVKVAVGHIEVKVRAEEEVRQEAYDKGWEDGIEAAEGLYAVSCTCSKCGKKKTVIDDDEKQALRRFMMANRWHHADCNDLYS